LRARLTTEGKISPVGRNDSEAVGRNNSPCRFEQMREMLVAIDDGDSSHFQRLAVVENAGASLRRI